MSKPLPSWFSTALGFTFLCGLVYAFYQIVALLLRALVSINPTVSAALITGLVTITASVSAVAIGRYLEKRKEVEQAFRERRLKTYESFIERFMTLTADQNKSEDDLIPFLRQMNKEMILWAGPELLKAYISFLSQASDDPTSGKAFLRLEAFYKAMREDLGHSNKGLIQGQILTLVVKRDEVEELLNNLKTNPDFRLKKKS